MVKKKEEYGPDVYRRLELVRKQFRNSVAEQKRQESAERRRRILSHFKLLSRFKLNKALTVRTVVFIVMAALVISVIWILITK